MSDATTGQETAAPRKKQKKTIQILRERRGGAPKEVLHRNRQQTALRHKIIDALKAGPKTVPELSAETGIPTHETLYLVMAMKKYGKVVEGDECDDYYQYQLVQEQPDHG